MMSYLRLNGRDNDDETPYDVIEVNPWRTVNRHENFERWAALNFRDYDHDYLAPNGVLYCSPPCGIIDNPNKGWTEGDFEPIYQDDYDRMVEEAGPGNGPGAKCPYCEYDYHCF